MGFTDAGWQGKNGAGGEKVGFQPPAVRVTISMIDPSMSE